MRKPSRSTLPSVALVLTTLGLAAAAGCSAGPGDAGPKAASNASHPLAGSCEAGASGLKPIGNLKQSNPVALGTFSEGPLAGKTIAFVADEDDKSVLVVDVDAKKQISSKKLEAAPGQVMILADGRLLVSVRGSSEVVVIHAATDGTLAAGCAVETSAEPVALAVTPDDATLLVTSGWGRSLESFETTKLTKKAKIDLPREPRQVVVDDDGKYAYVSHAVGGKTSVVDLGAMKAQQPIAFLVNPNLANEAEQDRPFSLASAVNGAVGQGETPIPGRFGTKMGCQGFPMVKSVEPKGRILAPQILVDPGDPENRAQGYGDGNQPTEVANVAVIDSGTRRLVNASVGSVPDQRFFGGSREPAAGECLLPRSAAVDDATSTVLVTCLGIDSVVAYDAASANPVSIEKARWDVGSGPTGIAVDGPKRRAVVWSQFERSMEIIALDDKPEDTKGKKHDRVAINSMTEPLPLAFVLGRQIFHAVGDARISNDGRACASCHPDGRDDAITWATPEGPRRSIMLAGRIAGTEPLAWNGTSKDLRDHLGHTFERLNGQGLRNVELEALVAYLESMPAPPKAAADNPTLVAKGKEIFHSEKAECGTCHHEGGTDNKVHDLGSKAKADRKPSFNTPALSYLAGRGQFFHDGRFESIRDLLVQSDGMMGHTKHLKPEEMDALEAYLRTL
ncbi:MAG: c-type cytochrome [Myxococcales bacterium]|nr:c-type cytochrome [Myxococcales bacterium]